MFLSALTFINTAAVFIRNSEHELKEELTLETRINLQSVKIFSATDYGTESQTLYFYHYFSLFKPVSKNVLQFLTTTVTINTLLMGEIHYEQLE